MSKSQITYHKSQIAKSHIPLTMRLREVTWQMNFIMYFVFTKTIATRLDRMVACEIKISTKV